NSVIARDEAWTARPGACDLRSGRHAWRFCAHRPYHSIQARAFAGWQFINEEAGGIQNFQFHFSKQMPLALVVIDYGSIRRIIADENRVAIGPPSTAFDPLLHRTRRNKRNI